MTRVVSDVVVPDAVVPDAIVQRTVPADKPLFIRYPGSRQGWILFDDNNVTAQHQKTGLELFIASDKDALEVSIPHALGGEFMATYKKSGPTDDNDTIVYSYTTETMSTVQMMYAQPAYVGYINRVTT